MEPPWWRTRSRIRAQTALTTTAPPAASIRGTGWGATGSATLTIACQAAASAGSRITAAITLPVLARARSDQPRARTGKVMAAVILLPALAAAWQAIVKVADPVAPQPVPLILAAGGAVVVNAACALILLRVRHHGGSMTRAAWLAARNDIAVDLAIVAMGLVTAWTASGWPDIVLGAAIIVLNLTAAKEVWEVAEEERLAAKALAGEEID